MAELFGVEVPAISKHLVNIYETGELKEDATLSILEIVQKEGNRNVKRKMEFKKYRVIQDKFYISDFDEEIKKLKK